jgi:hypothetical protein
LECGSLLNGLAKHSTKREPEPRSGDISNQHSSRDAAAPRLDFRADPRPTADAVGYIDVAAPRFPSRWYSSGPRMRSVTTYLAAALALAAIVFAWRAGEAAQGLDFYQFWIGGQAAHRQGTGNFYGAESRAALGAEFLLRAQTTEGSDRMLAVAMARPRLELFSTPLLYAVFGVFPGHYERDLFLYRIVCLLAALAAILLLAAALGYSPARALVMLAFVLLLFEPLRSDIRVGNVNQLQLFLISLFVWLSADRRRPWRDVAVGCVLALAVLFKPNVALLFPLLVAQRLFAREKARLMRELAGAALGALAGFAIGSIFFRSPTAWLDWLGAAGALSRSLIDARLGNVAPALPLARSLGIAASYVLLAVLTAATLFAMHRRKRDEDATPLVAGLALLLYLLSATLVWLHYLLLAIPLAMVLLRPRGSSAAVRVRQVVTIVALLRIGNSGGETQVVAIWIGLAGLFCAGLWELMEKRKG